MIEISDKKHGEGSVAMEKENEFDKVDIVKRERKILCLIMMKS